VRVAFVGLPLAALLLAADGHDVVWAGVCRRDALGTRRLRRVVPRVEIVPDLAACAAEVRALDVDLVVSWFWTRKVPRAFRELGRHGAIGVHPSLLPRWRGPDPFYWAIAAGDRETGVTAHALEEDYDTGDVLGHATLDIDPTWHAWSLARALDRPSLRLLRRVVRAYADGDAPIARAQDAARVTMAPAPTDDELELRWGAWTSEEIERRVRAAAPWPGAFTTIGDETLVLTRVRPTTTFPRALAPGEACVRDGVAIVRTSDGAVELLEGRLEDGDDALDADALAACVDVTFTTA
jgi:methionyl-tRNA formyltransferase